MNRPLHLSHTHVRTTVFYKPTTKKIIVFDMFFSVMFEIVDIYLIFVLTLMFDNFYCYFESLCLNNFLNIY